MKGEAGKYPTLRQQDLHIVAVGSAPRKGENAADELLRQLITLPRPVRVEFAKTAQATMAAAPLSPSTSASESFKNDQTLQRKEFKTAPPLHVEGAHSAAEVEQNERDGEEGEQERGGNTAIETPLRIDASSHESGAIMGESLPSTGEEERPPGEIIEQSDDAQAVVAGGDGEEICRDTSGRPRPRRHGTLPSAGWQEGRVGVVGGDDGSEEANVGQGPQGAGGQDGGQDEEGSSRQDKRDHRKNEGAPTTSEEEPRDVPRRPQRHGTLPEGIDWEDNLRSGRGGAVDPRTTVAVATQSVDDDESEGTSWSAPEEANFRSSPTNGSHSPSRSFYSANARRSHLVLTPEGSESSAWSNSRVHMDGADSIQRWLQVSEKSALKGDRYSQRWSDSMIGAIYQRISSISKRSKECSVKS